MTQHDAALDAFDRLCLRTVEDGYGETASTFLAKFQSAAASLEPNEWIKLEVANTQGALELLKVVLSDPHACKICALHWAYNGDGDVNSVISLLTNNCPELASLQVDFMDHLALKFVSSVLEYPSNKVKVLKLPQSSKGDLPRFFAALGQSQVSALTLFKGGSLEMAQGLCDYLTRDLLVRLVVKVLMGRKPVSSKVMMSLTNCTRLAELEFAECEFSQPTTLTHLPKSITKLVFDDCTFAGGFDWSFLTDSNVRELVFDEAQGVDGNALGHALAVHLRAKGLDRLCLAACDFVDETLAAVDVELGRIKSLSLEDIRVDDASVELIALTLQSPNSEMKELGLEYDGNATCSVEAHLVPALRHANCNLDKLYLWAIKPRHQAVAKTVQRKFHNRRALFALLQGQQVRRLYCPLRRLPVEMFRMVGQTLM